MMAALPQGLSWEEIITLAVCHVPVVTRCLWVMVSGNAGLWCHAAVAGVLASL